MDEKKITIALMAALLRAGWWANPEENLMELSPEEAVKEARKIYHIVEGPDL